MNERRVVITGVGVLSPLGNDLESTWEGLKAGKSGIGQITLFDTTDYGTTIAGEVKDFDASVFFNNPKDARRCDRYAQFGVAASKMAVQDSGIDEYENLDRTRVGVMIGSGIGGLGTLEREHTKLIKRSPSRVSPFVIPMMISNIASGLLSIECGPHTIFPHLQSVQSPRHLFEDLLPVQPHRLRGGGHLVYCSGRGVLRGDPPPR